MVDRVSFRYLERCVTEGEAERVLSYRFSLARFVGKGSECDVIFVEEEEAIDHLNTRDCGEK